jgi:hypothetical protein
MSVMMTQGKYCHLLTSMIALQPIVRTHAFTLVRLLRPLQPIFGCETEHVHAIQCKTTSLRFRRG